jgi:hypothetical protein
VTAGQLFHLADVALTQGDETTAQRAYGALMNDPSGTIRLEARFRLAMLESKRGNLAQAAVLLRQVVDARPGAARPRLELAQLLDRMGDKDGAWREIRAAQAAGLPPAVARIVDRYSEALRAARPVGASFEIAIAPDSNISRATRSNTLGTVFGDFDIDKDSKAKSGTGLSLQGQAFRRFAIAGDDSLLVRGSLLADLYRKSRFNDVAFDLAAGPELQWGRNRLTLEAGVTSRWYGQKPYLHAARIGATWTRPVGRQTQLRLIGSAALNDNRLNDLQDGKTYSGQVSLEHALAPTTGVAVTLGLNREALKDPGYSTTGWRAGLVAWRDVGRATLTAAAQFGRLRADDRLLLFPDKRSDRYSRITIGATFRQLTFGGFAPVTRLVIERNRSTIEFYDYRRTRTEIGIARAF